MLSKRETLRNPVIAMGLLILGIVTLGCTLSIDGIGAGSGTIAISSDSSTCVITAGDESNDCTKDIPKDTSVTLTATADADSTFTGWSGDCAQVAANVCTLTVDAVKAVTAA